MSLPPDRSLRQAIRRATRACKRCGLPVFYAQTRKGNRLALNAATSERGNAIVSLGMHGLEVEVLGRGREGWPTTDGSRHLPHVVGCPRHKVAGVRMRTVTLDEFQDGRPVDRMPCHYIPTPESFR